jgi:predicted nucleic acid-binding protein
MNPSGPEQDLRRSARRAVVLDTNVFVAAGFSPLSHAACIVAAIRSGRLEMIWCDETRCETERVLRKIPPLDWDAFADLFGEATRYRGALDPAAHAAVPDAADRLFAALAHATDAILVTQDDHLLAHRSKAGVPFLTAREFARFVLRDAAETGTVDDPSRLTPEIPIEEET